MEICPVSAENIHVARRTDMKLNATYATASKTVKPTGNHSDLYSAGGLFESRPGHRLQYLTLLSVSLIPKTVQYSALN